MLWSMQLGEETNVVGQIVPHPWDETKQNVHLVHTDEMKHTSVLALPSDPVTAGKGGYLSRVFS